MNPLDDRQLALKELWYALRGEALLRERSGGSTATDALPAFLAHVRANVEIYATSADLSLDAFPLTCRREVSLDPERFKARGIDGPTESKTGGTTGIPLEIRFDAGSWYDHNNGAYGYLRTALEERGARFQPMELGVAAVVTKPARDSVTLILPGLDFALYQRHTLGRGAYENTRIVEALRQSAIPVLHGKPCCLRELVDLDEQTAGHGRIKPAVIVTSGESLHDDDIARFDDWFGCPVIDAYISAEGGLIAFRDARSRVFDVLANRVVLELLGDDGKLGATGSGELVLTNPSNWGTAFIRYRTGDRGTLTRASSGGLQLELDGRESKVVATDEATLEAKLVTMLFARHRIWDFRVRPFRDRIECTWVPTVGSPPAAVIESELRRLFDARMGNVPIAASAVDQLTVPGGKRLRFPCPRRP